MYKKIQKKRKLLVLPEVPKENVRHLLKELSPKGLLIQTQCDSEKEARELLKKARDWAS